MLRGTVENLAGSQKYWLTSWARFDLGYTEVLVHDLFLLPPRLSEGDVVVVAGAFTQGRFEAQACFRPDESEEEQARRKIAERWRRAFWIAPAAAILLALWLWALFLSPGKAFMSVGLAAFPMYALFTKLINLQSAEMELALALATAEESAEPAGTFVELTDEPGERLK